MFKFESISPVLKSMILLGLASLAACCGKDDLKCVTSSAAQKQETKTQRPNTVLVPLGTWKITTISRNTHSADASFVQHQVIDAGHQLLWNITETTVPGSTPKTYQADLELRIPSPAGGTSCTVRESFDLFSCCLEMRQLRLDYLPTRQLEEPAGCLATSPLRRYSTSRLMEKIKNGLHLVVATGVDNTLLEDSFQFNFLDDMEQSIQWNGPYLRTPINFQTFIQMERAL